MKKFTIFETVLLMVFLIGCTVKNEFVTEDLPGVTIIINEKSKTLIMKDNEVEIPFTLKEVQSEYYNLFLNGEVNGTLIKSKNSGNWVLLIDGNSAELKKK